MPEAPSSSTETLHDAASDQPQKKLPPGQRKYKQMQMPTAEQIASDDFMNNCAVRTGLSGVMGSGLGLLFGVFMGTMDSSVSGLHGAVCARRQECAAAAAAV